MSLLTIASLTAPIIDDHLPIEEIARAVEPCHGKVEHVATSDAFEHNEPLNMSDEDRTEKPRRTGMRSMPAQEVHA